MATDNTNIVSVLNAGSGINIKDLLRLSSMQASRKSGSIKD